MLREKVVFGPIRSRRLGRSLGVNILPENGKICNFDCIYCECGLNKDGMGDRRIPGRAEVRRALENRLAEILLDGTAVDSITFSGDGEPTLNPEFPGIIEDTLKLRDIYCPDAKVSVLSNATTAGNPGIFDALCKVDNPIMKIDAPTNELVRKINNPAPGYDVTKVVESLLAFNGNFVLQTMFLKSPDFDSASPSVLKGWMDIVRLLKPRETMVYTVDRPAPSADITKYSKDEMAGFVAPLVKEGFKVSIFG